ncbi:MAG: hypothetical protein R8F63_15835 [Acidimicrobiales bacterium]|nr:hypothetical protein [Acidimicrobiales bacterium]
MDLRWQEEQRAFQARVLIDDDPDLALRPYRTFVGAARVIDDRHSSRTERILLTVILGAVVVSLLLAFGFAREFAALTASVTGGIALMMAVSPTPPARRSSGWTPLLAVYRSSVLRGEAPICVTQISVDEFERLGTEGFGTVVGRPRPGATFGLFVDDHLVWPRTPPRAAIPTDPGFGTN